MIDAVIAIAEAAGREILGVYASDFESRTKADNSPLTEADERAHAVIVSELDRLTPDVPILSEEGEGIPWAERRVWDRFWLVDPLDGTKEFLKRNGEFTVNIALIEQGIPVAGVVFVPVTGDLYTAEGGVATLNGERIQCSEPQGSRLRVVASRSHAGPDTEALVERYRARYDVELKSSGSSLKICRVAQGEADIYPRLGPTMEWDTGAANAILLASGGVLEDLGGERLRYGKDDLRNPHFIARAPWVPVL